MFKVLLAAHVIAAIFAVGPLVHAAVTAARGIRTGDAVATAASARLLRIYSIASVVVVLIGMGLMSAKEDGQKAGAIGELWIWLSLVLWVAAMGVVHGLVVPTLTRAGEQMKQQASVVTLTGRVAAGGGLVAILFAVIVVLMVYRPGH